MVQKSSKSNRKKVSGATSSQKEVKAKARSIQVFEPNPVPVVVSPGDEEPTSWLYRIVTFLMMCATVVIWAIVGQNIFLLTTQDVWLGDNSENKAASVSDEIVATIGGRPIFLTDVKKYANRIPQLSEIPFEMVYPQLLQTIVNEKVMLRAAHQAKTEDWPEVKEALQMSRDDILVKAYLHNRLKNAVTLDQLQVLYQQEMKNFTPVEEVRARHILVNGKKKAKDILVQLKAGADFGMLADKYSIDKSAKKGDLGYFTADMKIPEFSKVVFKLKPGQISGVFKTPFGWHIAKVEDRRMSSAPTFDEVKEQLEYVVWAQNKERIQDEERQKANVIVHKPFLNNPNPSQR